MTCRQIRRTLKGCAPVELQATVLAEIKHHAEGCAQCAKELSRAQKMDAAMALLLSDPAGAFAAESLRASEGSVATKPSHPRRPFRTRYRWLVFAGSTSVTLVAGILLGGFAGIALLAPQVDARASSEALDVPFLNEAFVHGGGFSDDFESGLGEWAQKTREPNYGGLSEEQAHSGSRSLKFLHRPYGGEFTKKFNTPVPPGGIIRLATWVLSPRGGTADNKWLNLGIGTGIEPDSGPGAGIDVLSVDSRWQPVAMQLNVDRPTPGFHIQLTSGPGHGQYSGWDWASWVDDVRVYLHAGVEKSLWTIEGDTLRMAVKLPKPYGPGSADLSRVYVRDLQKRVPTIVASDHRVIGDVIVFLFRSSAMTELIAKGEDSDGSPVSLQMVLSAQIGDIPCIFGAGIRRE